MWKIWANYLLPKTLKFDQSSLNPPNLVTLVAVSKAQTDFNFFFSTSSHWTKFAIGYT